ncbi:hypothetical protein AVEN_71306-1 [Araneus ventricosus]|uniref:Uncharacterized protein n=1 Tax=Araneus ventricosus TaxID=182803 RepID=A0A4Y2TAJ4_ARAVE|nr:hypothetical protein AVEN_71306-1 [Araneus ventricosus]
MHFGNERIISHHFPTNWPPRSLDLNPCDFLLWGYLNHVVFSSLITNLVELKSSIAQHIQNITTDTLQSVVEHAISRFILVVENDGQHIEHLLSFLWRTGFQLRVPQLPNDLEVIVLFVDFFSVKNR